MAIEGMGAAMLKGPKENTAESPDLTIIMSVDKRTDKTDCFTPCTCAGGNT